MRVYYFGLLATELGLRYHMCDLYSKFEEDGTKSTVAIVEQWCCGQTDRQTDRQTYTQVILYLSSAMHCIGQTTIELIMPLSVRQKSIT